MQKHSLILQLFEIGAVRFGSFPLKTGSTSPIYIDLRAIFAHPKLLVALAEALYDQVRGQPFEVLSVAATSALPIATAMSIEHSIPLILAHPEKPEYEVEPEVLHPKQPCLMIDDLILSGQTVLQTIAKLERKGLSTEFVAVFIDRQGKGRKRLEDLGYRLFALFTLTEIVEELVRASKINAQTAATVLNFLNK